MIDNVTCGLHASINTVDGATRVTAWPTADRLTPPTPPSAPIPPDEATD
jgi:hypothetical protein